MNTLSISLIISTYNWTEALEMTLQSVMRQSVLPNEVIVADDGSDHRTKLLLDRYKDLLPVPIIHVWQEDMGFRLAEIRNKAILSSSCDYIISIDGDVLLHRSFVEDHVKFAKKGCFVAGSRVLLGESLSKRILETKTLPSTFIFRKDIKNRLNGYRFPLINRFLSVQNDNIYNVRGCNMAFWREDLIAVNGFEGNYRGWGKEDTDIVVRLNNLGIKKLKIKFALIVYHIYHKEAERAELEKNETLLKQTIKEKRIRAIKGISEIVE